MRQLDIDRITELDDQISRFLKGMMSHEEEDIFRGNLSTDEELKNRVKEQLLLIKTIRHEGKTADNAIINATKSACHTPKNNNHMPFKFWSTFVSAAACIALVILFGVGHHNYGSAIQYASDTTESLMLGMPLTRGNDDSVRIMIEEYAALLNTEIELDAVIQNLDNLYALTQDEYVDIEDDYEKEIGWLLAVSYLKSKDFKQAKYILRKLVKSFPEMDEAVDLLNKLNKFVF